MKLMCFALSFVVVLVCTNGATAATLRATYLFSDTLAAQELAAPALVAVDPLALNNFENAIVYNQNRRVYHWDGNASPPTQQAGLSLTTTGLIPTNNYSVEMVFAFLEGTGNYRRILDVQNRTSDDGFYVDPSNNLNVYPVGSGTTAWTNSVFHHVVLTDASTPIVKGYLDGVLQFTLSTTDMHIQNPGNLLHFFLDNVAGGSQTEFSDGLIALIRVYEGVLTDSEVSQLAQNPFAPSAQGETENVIGQVSTGFLGQSPTGPSENPRIAGNSQFVAFDSSDAIRAQGAVEQGGCGDQDASSTIHVYRKRLGTQETLCLSRINPAGDGVSSHPAINHDGNLVVFQSNSTNLGCGNSLTNIYLATISGNASSPTCLTAGFGASSSNPAISANGNAVAYETLAVSPPNSTGCTGGQSKILVHILATGVKTCLTPGTGGPSVNPAISGDGSFVAFQTQDPSVAAGCGGVNSGIVRRLVSGTATCVTPNGDAPSVTPDISDDGLTIAFGSPATNFDAACSGQNSTNGIQQIFIWRFPGPPRCFSRTSPGGLPGDGPSRDPVLSGDGQFVAFTTQAGNLFLVAPGPFPAVARAVIAQAVDVAQVMRRNTSVATATLELMSSGVSGMGNGNSGSVSLDFSGRTGVFQSSATNLAAGDTNGVDDIVSSNETPPPPPGRVVILAPATGAVFPLTGPTPVTFVWTGLGTSTYGFEFSCPNTQFSNPNAAGPDSAVGFGSACGGGGFPVAGSSFTTTLAPGSIPSGTYNVRVIPLGIAGATFSDAIAITLGLVNAASNPTPFITAPANGVAAPIGGQVGFAWTAVIGAPQYLFSFNGPIAGSFPLATTTFAAAVPPIPSGAYQITITALNAAGQPLGPASTPVTVNVQ